MCGMTRRSARDFQVWRGKSGRQEKPFCALRVAIPLTRSAMDAEEESEQLERDGKKFEMEEPSTENLKTHLATWQLQHQVKARWKDREGIVRAGTRVVGEGGTSNPRG